MAKSSKPRKLKKRNLAAKAAIGRRGGPMKNKRRLSRQEKKIRDAREQQEQEG